MTWCGTVCFISFLSTSISNRIPKKNGTIKFRKREAASKFFDSIYPAVNARFQTSNNKYLVDVVLGSFGNKLSQSDKIVLDNRDTKESTADVVCALKQKISDNYFNVLQAIQNPFKIKSNNKYAKAKDRITGDSFKI